MEDESMLVVAMVWTILGIIFGIYFLIKIGAFQHDPGKINIKEPRVMSPRDKHNDGESDA